MRGQDAPFDHPDGVPEFGRHLDTCQAQADLSRRVIKAGALQAAVEMGNGAELRTDLEKGVNRRLVLWPDPVFTVIVLVPSSRQGDAPQGRIRPCLTQLVALLAELACRPGAPGPFQFFARAPVIAVW